MRLMSKNKVIIITGLSGAGRSTALKILEDIGYEAIDNELVTFNSSMIMRNEAAASDSAVLRLKNCK